MRNSRAHRNQPIFDLRNVHNLMNDSKTISTRLNSEDTFNDTNELRKKLYGFGPHLKNLAPKVDQNSPIVTNNM